MKLLLTIYSFLLAQFEFIYLDKRLKLIKAYFCNIGV
jgi:hypothetical protein